MSEYQCKKCGTKFEKDEACGCSCSKEDPKCPQCGATELEKIEGQSKLRDFLKNFNFTGG